ncbi:MAG TPA: LON peptidase substrate-binding domain-containing protein [Pyrinomonadaceae bacterium]|nr:LON peptidase substrate-binding domain-containing protein [Pyrinomonadaceae bacterium]
MSETFDKVIGIKQLPLFPLPIVLLPNELLPLHIFEPRYRQMLKDIELRRNIFGLSFLDPESGLGDKPEPGTIGCAAEVRESHLQPDGRSNILTSGLVRYRLLDYVDEGTPYYVGDVEFFHDEEEDPTTLKPLADHVHELFERVAKAAFKLSGGRGEYPEVPQAEPEALSFLVTAAFNLDNAMKYKFLEMTSTAKRLRKLRGILKRAVGKMEESADMHDLVQTNGHSKRKVDL